MSEKSSIQLGPWYGLLCFGAGSILTVVIATINSQWGPLSRITPLLGLTVLFWTVLGIVTGAYILIGRGWRAIDRSTRVRLALAYHTLAWAGLFAIAMKTPAAVGLIVFLGIAAAIGFIAYGIEHRPRNQDEGEIFP